jgi:hypothetical protein
MIPRTSAFLHDLTLDEEGEKKTAHIILVKAQSWALEMGDS